MFLCSRRILKSGVLNQLYCSLQLMVLRSVPLGRKTLTCFPGFRTRHSFLLANVKCPILGADFFKCKDLVIDIPRRRLYSDSVLVRARPASVISDLCGLSATSLEGILDSFPGVMSPSPVYDSSHPAKHGLEHTIPTDGPPVFARPRRLFGEKLQVTQQEFQKMM